MTFSFNVVSSFGFQWGTLLDAWMCDCWKCLSPFSLYVCADFLFHLIVFSNVCTPRKWRRKFFAIFLALTLTPHTHSTSIHSCWWCTCAAFCTVITSKFSSSSSSCCCYQALNSIKVIEQKYFWSWRWRYIVCVIRNVCVSRFSLVTLHPLLFTFPDYITL